MDAENLLRFYLFVASDRTGRLTIYCGDHEFSLTSNDESTLRGAEPLQILSRKLQGVLEETIKKEISKLGKAKLSKEVRQIASEKTRSLKSASVNKKTLKAILDEIKETHPENAFIIEELSRLIISDQVKGIGFEGGGKIRWSHSDHNPDSPHITLQILYK